MPANDLPPLLRVPREPVPLGKRLLLIAGAILCFAVGIFGWLVPVVTGVPFYLLGLILLGSASRRVLEWVNRQEARLSPRWRKKLRDALVRIPSKRLRQRVRR